MSGRFISRPADERAVERHGQRERAKDLFGLHHDLRTDTVASQQQDIQCVALSCLASRLDSGGASRSEEHTSELQSLMRISYAVFCLKKKTIDITQSTDNVI